MESDSTTPILDPKPSTDSQGDSYTNRGTSTSYGALDSTLHSDSGAGLLPDSSEDIPTFIYTDRNNKANNFTTNVEDYNARYATYHPFKKWLIGAISLEGFRTARLAFQSVGVIYGDIGTSPLYVFSAIFSDNPAPTPVEVYGALSLVIWSLFSIFILKYVTIVLCADDNGEGGTFALYSLICRYCDIASRGPSSSSDLALTLYNTDDFDVWNYTNQRNSLPWYAKVRRYINGSEKFQGVLLLIVLFGTSLVMGDGILTPAVSVLSAVEGVQIAFPDMEPYVVPVTVTIIFVLFMSQSMGTSRVAKLFAPVIVIWLSCLSGIGLYNISRHPHILQALSPVYAYRYFLVRGWSGWASLGGILLSISGVEALFADLGHFSRKSIRISATTMVLPSLLITYIGQAACIVINPAIVSNTFWRSVPKPVYWPMLIVATCAAIVASQAMVSAAFSIVHQAMSLGCFPKIRVVHTSRKIHGQVFVPEISALLMVLSISLVIIFQKSTSLTAAYGLASCMLMFLTTCLTSIVMMVVWKLNVWIVAIFFMIFSAIDLAFLSSTFLKIASGGWIPLAFAFVFSVVMNLWHWGSNLKYQMIKESQAVLNSLLYDPAPVGSQGSVPPSPNLTSQGFEKCPTPGWLLKVSDTPQPVARVPGMALYYSEADSDVPAVFSHTLNCFSSVPEMVVFVTLRVVVVPTVLPKERFLLTRLPIRGFYRCVARYGYMDVIEEGDEFAKAMVRQLEVCTRYALESARRLDARISAENDRDSQMLKSQSPEVQFAPTPRLPRPSATKVEVLTMELELLHTAPTNGITFVLGKSLIAAAPTSSLFRRLALNYGFHFLANNDRSFCLSTPAESTIQVGMPLQL